MRPSHAHFARTLLAGTVVAALAGCGTRTEVRNLDTRGLIAAIQAANERPGADVIHLAPGGLYMLRDAPRDATTLLPPITDDLRIEGNGAEIRRDADGRRALVEVAPGANVRLQSLTLAEGSDGAIRNYGTLRLDSVRVTDSFGGGSPHGATAIVLNHGLLEASDSEIAYNLLPTSARDAGTVVNYGELRLRNTAIHDNTTQSGHPGLAAAGAVLNLGTLQVQHASLADNRAEDGEQVDALAFPAVLNLGNGHVEGDLPRVQVREAGMVAVASR
jgi:hypothetical protein